LPAQINKEQILKTDYFSLHDRIYRRIIKSGREGWSTRTAVKDMVEIVLHGVNEYKTGLGSLLELGCGDGSISIELTSHGFSVCGIDIVPIAISWASEKSVKSNSVADFIVGKVTGLPCDGCSFDLVLDASCSRCIIGSDRKDFFSEAFRVLKPSGLFILNALCNEPSEEMKKYFDEETRCLVKKGIAGRFYGLPESIASEAETAGFRILKWYTEKNEFHDEEMILYCTKE
jgi:ubiquinone/menaquinone biosynthesis C-methylase UbiE